MKKIFLPCLILLLVVCLVACTKDKTGEVDEQNETNLSADTDWQFEEPLPCGWFVFLKNGDTICPTDDFSSETALYAYYDCKYDDGVNAYELKQNQAYLFDVEENEISSDNATGFASLTLRLVMYYSGDLLMGEEDNKAFFYADPVKLDCNTREIKLGSGSGHGVAKYGTASTFINGAVNASRVKNGNTETAQVKMNVGLRFERMDDLGKVTVIEYNDLGVELKRANVEKNAAGKDHGITLNTAENAAYVVVEREWTVPYDGARGELKKGETYRTREILQKENDFDEKMTKLWYPTAEGLCEKFFLTVHFD